MTYHFCNGILRQQINNMQTNENKKIYIELNKPVDYLCNDDSQGKSVVELLTKDNGTQRDKRDIMEQMSVIGNLDEHSEGLILLTNDANLTNLIHKPTFELQKEYDVVITDALSKDAKKVLERGMRLNNEFVEGIEIKKEFNKGRLTIVTVSVKNAESVQIRKMFETLGYHITTLRQTRLGKLRLGTLAVGKWKFVSRDSII